MTMLWTPSSPTCRVGVQSGSLAKISCTASGHAEPVRDDCLSLATAVFFPTVRPAERSWAQWSAREALAREWLTQGLGWYMCRARVARHHAGLFYHVLGLILVDVNAVYCYQ